jgi:hypothetical protein
MAQPIEAAVAAELALTITVRMPAELVVTVVQELLLLAIRETRLAPEG